MPIHSEQEASLICFGEAPANLELRVLARRDGCALALEYRLSGALDTVKLPTPGRDRLPERLDGLWETTCFEAFISETQQPFYWELNASPELNWNLYHFRSYREARKPEPRIPAPRLEVLTHETELFRLRVSLDLSRVVGEQTPLELAMTTVLERGTGEKSYWALMHPKAGGKPDFHLRQGFQLRI